MASVAKRPKSESPAASTTLLGIYDDVLLYIIHFLNGRALARLGRVCKQLRDNSARESVAHSQFIKTVPGFEHLDDSLLRQHIQYTDMQSGKWSYLYHLSRCYPTVQEINSRQRGGTSSGRTQWNRPDHIHYFLEKLFGKGNVVLMVRTLSVMKQCQIWNYFKDDGVIMFLERFMRYGSLLGEYKTSRNWPYDSKKRFKYETQLHLLEHHRDILNVGEEGFDAMIHHLMMRAIEDGMADIAVRFRKMGATLKADSSTTVKWRALFQKVNCSFFPNEIWMSFKSPKHPGTATEEQLERMLAARMAVYAEGNVQETEKLHHLADLLGRDEWTLSEYSIQQKMRFLEFLLSVGGVSESIRTETEQLVQEFAQN